MKQKFHVTGMTCSACSSRVEKSVSKLNGLESVSVNLLTNSMQVEYDASVISDGDIIEAVEHAGYGASVQAHNQKKQAANEPKKNVMEDELKNMKVRSSR